MSCIGVFYSVRSNGRPNLNERAIKGNLYINYFKFRDKKWNYERFWDIGLLIKDVSDELDKISFYIPFSIEKDRIQDLGGKLFSSDMLGSLFNHKYQVTNSTDSRSYAYAKSTDDEHPNFWIYELNGNNFSIISLSEGTVIQISINSRPKGGFIRKADEKECNLYFRFRIKDVSEKDFGSVESISNDWLQSAFSKMEMVGLSINNEQLICKADSEILLKDNLFLKFEECHFFFIGSSKDERVTGNNRFIECMLLDSPQWVQYVEGHNAKGNKCLSYHWEAQQLSSPEFFVTTVYSKWDSGKVVKYLLVVVFLGVLASFIAGVITGKLFSNRPIMIKLQNIEEKIDLSYEKISERQLSSTYHIREIDSN